MVETTEVRPHLRRISWKGASSLALGGSNQSIFLIGALLAAQGSAAIPILIVGLLLSYMATPGWIELSCMFPERVGGIAATCAEAFRPYSAVLANLTGVCYWWGWVPTCGLTAIFSADAIHQWYLPGVPVKVLATILVLCFMGVNLCGLKWAVRVAMPIAIIAGLLALCTSLIPIFTGHVDWHQASSFHLNSPFSGAFGKLTSAMAGLYLVGFAAPAFEAAACHIGEMRNPTRDQPWAMWFSGGVASIYFVVIPVVWLGVFGSTALQGNLASLLGPTFAPLFGSLAKGAAIWFITFNMFSGTIQPLSGASRTLSQLSEDGLLPKSVGFRSIRTDAPVIAIVVTATASIIFLLSGDPTSVVAAANLTYLIGIALPSVAVAILRRNEPDRLRPYRAKRASIWLGVAAAVIWLASTIFGFEQFGLPIVIFGLALAYSGSIFYAWRLHQDAKTTGIRGPKRSIHLKLTGAMLAVLVLDGVGYLVAINHVTSADGALIALLKDLFVAVGLLTITVGLILPGMIAHTANQVASAAKELADGTLLDLTTAMEAMATGDFDRARSTVAIHPVEVRTQDEFGEMAKSFNVMQLEVVRAAGALDVSVEELRSHHEELERLVAERTVQLSEARGQRRALLENMRMLSSRISGRSGEQLDLGSTLSDVLGALGETLGVDTVLVQLAHGDGVLDSAATIWRHSQADLGVVLEDLPEPVSGLLNEIAERRATVAIRDLSSMADNFESARVREFIVNLGIGGMLACPFFTSDGVLVGLLVLAKLGRTRKWSEDEVALVETVAADFSRAVISAQLYSRQQQLVFQLQELDKIKTDMISTFSHELRTPLSSIRAYVELLRDSDEQDADENDRMLEIIERNTIRLSEMLEDILTLSHLSSEVFDIPLRPLSVDTLLQGVTAALEPSAQTKDVHLSVDPASQEATVLGDSGQLERLLFNLIGNAIKFTPPRGSVTVLTTTSATEVIVTVTDTGIGIPAKEVGQVFERFYRGSNAARAAIPGTGLGLAIAEAIVEHHNGTIALAPNPEGGTVATVVLPRAGVGADRSTRATMGKLPAIEEER